MAVERRVRIDLSASEELSIKGVWPGGALSWTPGQPSSNPLIAAIAAEVENWLREKRGGKGVQGASIRVDSSALFSPDGRKSGLGSSAAVTVGLVCALLDAAGCRPIPDDPEILALAIRAHRRSQGGAGSGYDVSCSFHGRMGVFHGGILPRWEPCRLWEDPVVCLFPGPSPVSTSEAIRLYALWKKSNPDDARRFLEDSNRNVQGFVHARAAVEAQQHLRACRELGVSLGRAIGVSAEIAPPLRMDSAWCKALGAGNELGACLLQAGSAALLPGSEVPAVDAAQEGVLWEE